MAHEIDIEKLRREKPELVPLPDASLNAETPLTLMRDEITPTSAFFVRNNGRIPEIGPASKWKLAIDGHVDHPTIFESETLRRRFEVVTITSVLECAGNNRLGFEPPTDGLAWGRGAVGCAPWTGVRMRDVLTACGVRAEARYTGHHSPDLTQDGSRPAISRGIPIEKALAPETLIAWAMNDKDLTLLHGAPLRVVAPGLPGSAWQKWLSRIEVRDRIHDGEKMNGTDYRLPRGAVRPGDSLRLDDFEVIEKMPVNAMITSPSDCAVMPASEPIEIVGFAWSGTAAITKVEISVDEGRTWRAAQLGTDSGHFAWRRFDLQLDCSPGEVSILARATDASADVQPLEQAAWNPRGYCNNAAHCVTVQLR